MPRPWRLSAITVCVLIGSGCAQASEPYDVATASRQVAEAERAFAQTMADRNHTAFTSFLADDAIFFSGTTPLRGKVEVGDAWAGYFEESEAPFSWAPKTVEVLSSGSLALSTGPVLDPDGECIATFTSVWREESPGVWKIVFDRGAGICE